MGCISRSVVHMISWESTIYFLLVIYGNKCECVVGFLCISLIVYTHIIQVKFRNVIKLPGKCISYEQHFLLSITSRGSEQSTNSDELNPGCKACFTWNDIFIIIIVIINKFRCNVYVTSHCDMIQPSHNTAISKAEPRWDIEHTKHTTHITLMEGWLWVLWMKLTMF